METPDAKPSSLSVPELPEDIFHIILDELEAWDVVRCQKVSRLWHETFSKSEYLRQVLKKYPKARELRPLSDLHDEEHNPDWKEVFNSIASRYYHLTHGKTRKIEKYKIAAADQHGHWFPVGQWDYHESQPGGRLYFQNAATHLSRLNQKPYLFRACLWSYDDGLLAGAFLREDDSDSNKSHILSILDVPTGILYPVPFDITNKVIRNISLHSRTLIIEWAESTPYHDLTDSEKVHRHFATCYDVQPHPDPSTNQQHRWLITLRNEWKIHFLGLPLNSRDRFFSTHTRTHYAIYIHQPNRSMYTGDEDNPIEALFVYDISRPSSYLPSLDPTNSFLPPQGKRPHMLSRFTFRDLDFLGLRQGSYIRLLSLHLDLHGGDALTVKENVTVVGQGYFDPAERLMCATSTSFPFLGSGPHLKRQFHEELPPYRGHCTMESAEVEEPAEKWFNHVMDVVDRNADVRFSLVETCFTGLGMENRLVVRVKAQDKWVVMEESVVREVGVMGMIAGDERWMVGQNGGMEVVVVRF